MPKCIVCDKKLKYEPQYEHPDIVYGGTSARFSPGYGSRYDMLYYNTRSIMFIFVCDDCFEKKWKSVERFQQKIEKEQLIRIKMENPNEY